jgi:hypothetical protein
VVGSVTQFKARLAPPFLYRLTLLAAFPSGYIS